MSGNNMEYGSCLSMPKKAEESFKAKLSRSSPKKAMDFMADVVEAREAVESERKRRKESNHKLQDTPISEFEKRMQDFDKRLTAIENMNIEDRLSNLEI